MLSSVRYMLGGGIFAAEAKKSELKDSGMRSVEFINYTGEHKEIDSVSAIKEIGTDLGKSVVAEKPSSHGSRDKYAIVHAVDADEKEKLDADIFFIGKDATVARYKTAVMKNLSKKNCGLSTSYKDWPEKTEMVIPLSVNGKSVKVDASALRDEKVANYMKEGDKKKNATKGLRSEHIARRLLPRATGQIMCPQKSAAALGLNAHFHWIFPRLMWAFRSGANVWHSFRKATPL